MSTTPVPLYKRPAAYIGAAIIAATAAFFAVRPAPAPAPRACPEAVVYDGREPRNATGHIRQCWPGEAKCHCDRDNDCYRLDGYKPCVPVAADAGAPRADAGRTDAGTAPTADLGQPPRDAGAPPSVPDAGPAPTLPPVTGLRAFPGAEGFGAGATGGRGGRVVFVTTLAASGAGSLADALSQAGARTVVFRVSGVIHAEAHVRNGDVTIAGQTSPGGITVRGIDTTEEPFCDQQCGASARGVSNVVVRHLRSRPAGGTFPDGVRLRYVRNVVLDHVSVGNAEDEAVELSYANAVTLQDCLLAETVGGHANYGGMLINYTNPAAGYALDGLTVVRTVWNRLGGRYPEFSRESGAAAAGTTLRAEFTNNLLWDQRYFIDVNPTNISGGNDGAAVHYALNWVGNVSAQPAGSPSYGVIWFQSTARSNAYFSGNVARRWPGRADWDFNYCCNDFDGSPRPRPSTARTARFDFPAVRVLPAADVIPYAVANAGAFPRDPMDRRLMGDVAAGRFDPRRNDANPVGDALLPAFSGAAPAPPPDGDSDGMDDAWERANGLNPTLADHNGTGLSLALTGVAGYTNLECYLDALARRRVLEGR